MTLPSRDAITNHFTAISDSRGREILNSAKLVELPKGTTVFRQGDQCPHYLLVVEGSVRVFARAENGREIVLYRIGDGGSCVLTTTCLLGHKHYPAEGVTETAVKALAIPASDFFKGLEQSPSLRDFIFNSYGERLAELIVLIEEVTFSRIDIRLAHYLLEHADAQSRIATTHQSLAIELGSAREVVSRQLKEFERKNWLVVQRGQIKLLDSEALKKFIRHAKNPV